MENERSYRVLVIDDDREILNLLKILLSRKGHIIDTARSGEEGLSKIREDRYDCVITDIRMPGMSGETVLMQIKEELKIEVPVIGMSGTPWLLGNRLFDAVIAKPCNYNTLLNVINKVASSR